MPTHTASKLLLRKCVWILLGLYSLALVSIASAQAPKRISEPVKMDKLWGESGAKDIPIADEHRWYQEAKFAMFIHWGLYSKQGGIWEGEHHYGISEWLMKRGEIPVEDYETIADGFNPVNFDADAIAQLAVDAGMKYIVITSKHHDGFAMFHSKVSEYNIVDATPFGRDIIKELADACKRYGLKLGFYYSQSQDWHEKNAMGNTWDFKEEELDFQKYLHEKAIPQVKEILTNYGDIGIIWFDTPVGITEEQVIELKAMVKELQPNCLVNSRIGHGLGDFTTLGDNQIPDHPLGGLWESIDTHNNSWAFSHLDINWKTDTEIIHRFIRVICKGGNYMFNIGPKGDGSVPIESRKILPEVGKWIRRYEEAIYGTLPVDMGNQVWLEATRRPGKTYLFIRDWPTDGRLWLPGLEGVVANAYFLVNGQPLIMGKSGKDHYLHVPTLSPDAKATVIVLEHSQPISFNAGQWIVPGMENELMPHSADITGINYTDQVRWMEIFGDWQHYPILHEWEGKGSSAEWEFYTPGPGQYLLDIHYSCDLDSDLKEGLLVVDGKKQNFVPVYTGDTWEQNVERPMPRYMSRRIGLINVAEKGNHTLRIQLDDDDSTGWIRLNKIKLSPAH